MSFFRFAIAVLLLAPSVSAEWPAATKAEVLTQLDAIALAFQSQSAILEHAAAVPADAALVHDAIDFGSAGWLKHARGAVWLFDGNGGDNSGWLPILENETRAQIVARGFAGISGSVAQYNAALSRMASMSASAHRDSAIALLGQARDAALTFDTSLDYNEPRLDENLVLFPGVRGASANFGPHGGYRLAMNVASGWMSAHQKHWRALADEVVVNPAWASVLADTSNHLRLVARAVVYGMGLLAAVEETDYAAQLDIMEAGGTTTRSRHFFRGLLVSEAFLAFTHNANPAAIDVNGRVMERGIAYDFDTACGRYAAEILATAALPAHVYPLAVSIREICAEWAKTDDFVQTAVMTLKWHQVFPPNPPSGGECPECPPPPAQVTCGIGTFLQGNECLASPVACSAIPALVDTGSGYNVVCVEQ